MNSMAIELSKTKSNELNVLDTKITQHFSAANLASFEQLWSLPRDFVEEPNIRRNGWSGTSIVRLKNESGVNETFYLKRQENQARYSLRYITGAPTFRYEADALVMAQKQDWPSVDLIAYGSRVDPDTDATQTLLVTRALEQACMLSSERQGVDWNAHLSQLRRAGERILAIHQDGWQHGALFPAHVFIDLRSGEVGLIDFERARKKFSPKRAAYADFTQLIRRSAWLPDAALEALLEAHTAQMPSLRARLAARFPQRFNNK